MEGYLAALTTTIVFTGIFSVFLVYMDTESIKQNWDKRRCELPVLITSSFYKPNDNPQSSTDFAADNFNYCVKSAANEVIRAGLFPYYKLAGQQAEAQNSMTGPMNNMRGAIATTQKQFSNYIGLQYRKFESIFIGITKSTFHMRYAIGRIEAIVYSVIYMLISIFMTIMNTMRLTLLATKIFLAILLALMIILYFILSPFMVIIVAVVAAIAAAGLAGVEGAEDAMCCDPNSIVKMKDGTTKLLKDVQKNDILQSINRYGETNIVKGILIADATKTSVVEIDGITMSKSHRVFYKNKWILANDHPNAIVSFKNCDTLICLNTTEHSVTLVGNSGTLTVSDWEEVSTLQGQRAWIDIVHFKLNGYYTGVGYYPTALPLVSPKVCVFSEERGRIPIESVQLGERIQSKDGYTSVKAIYDGCIHVSKNYPYVPEWISDGVWIQDMKYNSYWYTSKLNVKEVETNTKNETKELPGMFLITDDGMCVIECNEKQYIVRDFTELGLDKIHESYEIVDFFMNKK
jgi:hypothetical protein